MPEFGHRVLIWAGAWEIAFRYKRGDKWVWFDGKFTEWDPEDVKLWRELPDNPEGESVKPCSYSDICDYYTDCDIYRWYSCDREF